MELTAPILLAAAWAYFALLWCLAPVPIADAAGPEDTFSDRDRITRWLNGFYSGYVLALTAAGALAWVALVDWHFARLPRGLYLVTAVPRAAPTGLGGFCAFLLALPLAYPLAWRTIRLIFGTAECGRYALWSEGYTTPSRKFLLRAASASVLFSGALTWYTLTHYVRFEEDRVVASNWFGVDGTSYSYDRVKYVVQSDWEWSAKQRRSYKSLKQFVVFDDGRVVPIYPDRYPVEGQIWPEAEVAAIVCTKSGKPLTEVCFGADAYTLP